MNKPAFLGLSILELINILMYQFYHDYLKTETDDIYKDVAEDFETRFDTSNYKLDRTIPKGKKYSD